MKSAEEKYINDPQYRRVVQSMEMLIHDCQLTPGEVREAAMLACIHYEIKSFQPVAFEAPEECIRAVDTLTKHRLAEYQKIQDSAYGETQ